MAVVPNIRFSKSNFVEFKRLEDSTLLQSDTTRFSSDFVYNNVINTCYFTKILQSENAWFQFRTNYSNYSAYIISELGVEVNITSSIAKGLGLSNERFQYECYVNLASYLGYFKFKVVFDADIDKPIATYESEWFEIATSFENHLQIEWKNATFNPYDDGIIWGGTTQKIWVDSTLIDYIPGVEKSVLTTSNYKLITTQAQPTKSKKWKIELAPDYLYEILNNALQHDYFLINGVRLNSEETFEIERQGDTTLYPCEISLRVVEDAQGNAYEDYSEDQAITGTLPTISAKAIFADTGKAIFAGEGKALGYY